MYCYLNWAFFCWTLVKDFKVIFLRLSMINKKKSAKDYARLSLKIIGISFISLILIMILSTILNIIDTSTRMLIYEIIRVIVLISISYFFISVAYYQFKNTRVLWAVINLILLVSYLSLYGNDTEEAMIPLVIGFISCLVYYLKHIKPKFKNKK